MFKVALVDFSDRVMYDYAMYKSKFDPSCYQVDEIKYYDGRQDELVSTLDGYDALIQSGGFFEFTPEMIKSLKTIKIIYVIGTGYVSELADAAAEAGIKYCAVNDYSTKEVADHACAFILALNRHLFGFNRAIQKDHVWNSRMFKGDMPKLETLTLGICGFGAIGRAVASRMQAFHVNSLPSAARMPALVRERGMAPSSTPCGQRYLQKNGSPIPISLTTSAGSSTTMMSSTAYFRYRSGFSRLVEHLGEGILCKSSCSQPNGHKNPHTKRPSSTPSKMSVPVT